MSKCSLSLVLHLLLACLLVPSPLCGQSDLAGGKEPKPVQKLRIGVAPSQPPIIFKQGDKISGVEADLARAFATRLGREPEFVELSFRELIPALLDGKIDIIMSGMSSTDLRAIRINFTQPYLKIGQMPLVRAKDVSKYPTMVALINTSGKIGVEQSTTGDRLVQENFFYADRKSYDDIRAAAKDLASGKIDILIYDSPAVWWMASEYESKGLAPLVVSLSEEFLAWGLRKDDTMLQEQADAFLADYRNSGELQKIMKKWMPYAQL